MKFTKCYEVVERKIGGAFARYGRFVSHHAWKIIVITIIVNGALGIGMIKLQSDIDSNNVYIPHGTQARKDKDREASLFPDLSGSNYNSRTFDPITHLYTNVIVRASSGTFLDRSLVSEIQSMSNFIENITATNDDGSIIRFSDICAISHSQCVIQGDLFWDPDFLSAIDNGNVSFPVFTSSTTGRHEYSSYIGTYTLDNSGQYLKSVQYIRLGYYFRSDDRKYEAMSKKWMEAYLDRVASYQSSSNFDFAYGTSESLDTELDKNIAGDIGLISVTFTLMITYACVATLSYRITDQVGQRMWLGFGGILAAGLAIVASFGFCAAVGVDFVSIVGVLPFLIIGIGIDDMFILLSGLSEAQGKHSVEDKMAETLRISGVGITITSLTDLIAFLAGAGSSFIAVRNFCIYTAVAVLFCYINNVTLFAACIAINERRVHDHRHYLTCRRIKSKETLKIEGKPKRHVICCGGRPPRNREEAESFLDKLPRWLIPRIVLKLPFKIIIIILFLGYLAGGIYGCINMKQGLVFSQLVSDDSYYYKYTTWDKAYFVQNIPVAFIFPDTHAYSNSETLQKINDLISSAHASKYYQDNTFTSWLHTYMTSRFFDNSSESAFVSAVKLFIADPEYSIFENDVIFDVSSDRITSSRIYLYSGDLDGSQEEGKFMLESRDIAADASINCFAYSPAFVAFEQYVAILGQTLQSVGIALAAVFVITCIFMPHPVLIAFVTVVVAMIMVGVFGYIYYLDVALSSITMIHMIMSIGFSIDFTAHICHGYMISNGETRDIRVKQAIDKTGAPIFHGAVSSLLGILVLLAAKSYIFRTFSAVMAFVLLFGIAHALLFLPVILSWIGPGRLDFKKDATDSDNKSSSSSRKELEWGEEKNGPFCIESNNRVVGSNIAKVKSPKRTNNKVGDLSKVKCNESLNSDDPSVLGTRSDLFENGIHSNKRQDDSIQGLTNEAFVQDEGSQKGNDSPTNDIINFERYSSMYNLKNGHEMEEWSWKRAK